jgi:hypothetical protein
MKQAVISQLGAQTARQVDSLTFSQSGRLQPSSNPPGQLVEQYRGLYCVEWDDEVSSLITDETEKDLELNGRCLI